MPAFRGFENYLSTDDLWRNPQAGQDGGNTPKRVLVQVNRRRVVIAPARHVGTCGEEGGNKCLWSCVRLHSFRVYTAPRGGTGQCGVSRVIPPGVEGKPHFGLGRFRV